MYFYANIVITMIKGKEVFIANTATVIGNIEMGDNSSVWFGAVVRGDNDKITIGDRSNIQDLSVIHVDEGVPVNIGKEVTIGHGAIVHGATIGDNSLIGMRSTLLNNVVIGKNCIVGAHALVTEGKVIPDNSLVIGMPAKVVKTLSPDEIEKIKLNYQSYVKKGKEFLNEKY